MKIKGTWVEDYIKMIRANKDKNWNKYLEPADWEIVNGRVLSSTWYPYESYNRIGKAVFREIAGENLEASRAFGKMFAEKLAAIYKNILVEGDPSSTIAKIYALQGTFFRDIPSLISPAAQEPNRSAIKIGVTEMERNLGEPKAFAYQFQGMLEQLLSKVGTKIKSSVVREIPDGYEIEITW